MVERGVWRQIAEAAGGSVVVVVEQAGEPIAGQFLERFVREKDFELDLVWNIMLMNYICLTPHNYTSYNVNVLTFEINKMICAPSSEIIKLKPAKTCQTLS